MRRLFTSLKTTAIKPQKSILHISGCVLVKIILFCSVWQCGWKRGCVGASNQANKWQNKHSQSWFRPLIQCCTDMSSSYSLMMHLPGCFLLTRLFQGYPFYRARWCRCKVFWVSHPHPTYLYNLSAVYCRYTVFFVLVCVKLGKKSCLTCILKKSTFCCCWYFSPKKDNAFHRLAFMILSWLHVRSTLQMLTNHYPFHGDSFLLPIH